MRTNKKWLLLVFFLSLFAGCSTLDEKTLPEESERNLKANSSILAVTTWPRPTPILHVGGKHLKDPCDNNVVLHGVALTPSPWFNGCQYGANSGYCTWDNYNVQGALNYNKAVMDKLSNSSDGWYLNYIRLHIDPYWTNDPGAPIPENDISRFNYNRLVTYTDQVIVPLINHARSRGMYVILRPPGVCPHRIAVNDAYHSYLKTIWTFLSQHPGLKNADNVMFELANEPVEILGTNGVWGTIGNEHFAALKNFFQPLVNIIRNNGANNVCWIPGTGWQSHYQGYVNNPITGGNIGYAVHIYPGYWGGVNNYQAFQNAWNTNVKPIADIAPIAITETDWAPQGYGTFGTGTTGTAGGNGFGANLKYIVDQAGNVSWNLLAPDNLIHKGDPNAGTAYNNDWEACAAPSKQWFQQYASSNYPVSNCNVTGLVNNGIYEIEFQTDANKVLDLKSGEDINGAVLRPWTRNGATAQRWVAIDAGNGYWRFVSKASASNRCIDLTSNSNTLGTAIRLWQNYGNDAQAWQVVAVANGYYKILSKVDVTRGWDVPSCAMDGNSNLHLWDYYGTSCQLFKFKFIAMN
ncbi:MAG: carbohydrate-binding protein [Sphingobacterium sp.]|jgi:hypothetical protein|nr:carbohydrate-binding protein [Sphingobacterium sp.]